MREATRMLLSFERPLRQSAGRRLFADLENCTVANDTGITGQSRKALPEITVKIVRAYGGCLGTKSRRRA